MCSVHLAQRKSLKGSKMGIVEALVPLIAVVVLAIYWTLFKIRKELLETRKLLEKK